MARDKKGALTLLRKEYTDISTIGELSLNGSFLCYVLEDKVRDINKDGDLLDAGEQKIYGKTAIPAGTYDIIINMSNRFKVMMPLLLKVPGYEGVRIHSGNKAEDTEGCLIVGMDKAKDMVTQSRDAYKFLMFKLKDFDNITIKILDKL